MNTTLNRIRAASPCVDGWHKLLTGLGKTTADDEPLSLVTILDINGLDDAIWALRCVDDQAQVRRYAVRCARQVQNLMTDPRSLAALDVAERHADGQATDAELDAAWVAAEAAGEATRDAAWAATVAAWTTRDVARDAAGVAARGARYATWAAASDAVSDAQEAQFRLMFGGDK